MGKYHVTDADVARNRIHQRWGTSVEAASLQEALAPGLRASPEVTDRTAQWGTLEEVMTLSGKLDTVIDLLRALLAPIRVAEEEARIAKLRAVEAAIDAHMSGLSAAHGPCPDCLLRSLQDKLGRAVRYRMQYGDGVAAVPGDVKIRWSKGSKVQKEWDRWMASQEGSNDKHL